MEGRSHEARSLEALEHALQKLDFKIPSKREASQLTIFKDCSIEAGEYWRLELLRELEECDAGIVFLTSDLNVRKSQAANQAMIIDRAWLFYEASRLYHRMQFDKLINIVPIFVGTDINQHALAKWAILRFDELQIRQLDASNDNELKNQVLTLAKEIATKSTSIKSNQSGPDTLNYTDPVTDFVKNILYYIDLRTLKNVLLQLVVPSNPSKDTQERLHDYMAKNGDSAKRVIANALLAGPSPREPGDQGYIDAYYENVERIARDFWMECDKRRGSDRPSESSLADCIGKLWVSIESAMLFSNSWADLNTCARTYVFIHDLDDTLAKTQDWEQIFYEFFLAAWDVSPIIDRGECRPDGRIIRDLQIDFWNLCRGKKLDHVVDMRKPYPPLSKLTESVNCIIESAKGSDIKLPLIIDPTAKLLTRSFSKAPAPICYTTSNGRIPLEDLIVLRSTGNRPPCILIATNKSSLVPGQLQDEVIVIPIKLSDRCRLRECLEVDNSTQKNGRNFHH